MKLFQKLKLFFEAIESIEKFEDDSIVIKWKSNVAQEFPKHNLAITGGYQVNIAKEIHLNPGTFNNIIAFEDLDEKLVEAKKNKTEKIYE
jgi:hypothetical protein